jgi:hypothetical protein
VTGLPERETCRQVGEGRKRTAERGRAFSAERLVAEAVAREQIGDPHGAALLSDGCLQLRRSGGELSEGIPALGGRLRYAGVPFRAVRFGLEAGEERVGAGARDLQPRCGKARGRFEGRLGAGVGADPGLPAESLGPGASCADEERHGERQEREAAGGRSDRHGRTPP